MSEQLIEKLGIRMPHIPPASPAGGGGGAGGAPAGAGTHVFTPGGIVSSLGTASGWGQEGMPAASNPDEIDIDDVVSDGEAPVDGEAGGSTAGNEEEIPIDDE